MTSNASNTIAVDSNALTYLVDAHEPGYDPATDADASLAAERTAILRTYLYGGRIYVLPTVEMEYERIRQIARKAAHTDVHAFLLEDVRFEDLDQADIESKVAFYKQFHPREQDCRVVAEAENLSLDCLLTCDTQLLVRLGPRVSPLRLCRPSEYWDQLGIPRGSELVRCPAASNPLSAQNWYMW